MADINLEHTAAQIDYAVAAMHADTVGPTHPSSEVSSLGGTETIPLRLPSGQLVFISWANILADIITETGYINDVAERARDAAGQAIVDGLAAGDGVAVTLDDVNDEIQISVDTLDGGTY